MKTNNLSLSIRLECVKDMVDCRRVADVGCDHGKLVESLFKCGAIDYALVSDISQPSVNKAVQLLTENNRSFDYAVGDGLSTIKPEHNIEQVVISGMGGLEIIKILSHNPLNINNFVLQPQNNQLLLKKWLIKNNYHILKDVIVKDKHMYYNVIKVKKSYKKQRLNAFNIRFGKDNFAGNLYFYNYLLYYKEKFEKLLKQLPLLKRLNTKYEIKLINKAIAKWERENENNTTISKA